MRGLVERGALGIVTTHDLALAQIVADDASGRLENVALRRPSRRRRHGLRLPPAPGRRREEQRPRADAIGRARRLARRAPLFCLLRLATSSSPTVRWVQLHEVLMRFRPPSSLSSLALVRLLSIPLCRLRGSAREPACCRAVAFDLPFDLLLRLARSNASATPGSRPAASRSAGLLASLQASRPRETSSSSSGTAWASPP